MSELPGIPLSDKNVFQTLNGLWKGKKLPLTRAIVVRNTNFTNDGILDFSDVAELDVETKQLESRTLQTGDIVIERSGGGPKQAVGRVCFFNAECKLPVSFSNFTSVIRVLDTSRLLPRYVHYRLLHLYKSGYTEGLQHATTGIRNLDFSSYLEAEVPLLSKSEQEKIAAILWKLQRAIATQNRLIATTRDLKQSTMAQLFTHGLRGEALKETEIGPTPESWSVERFDSLAVLHRGFDLPLATRKEGSVPIIGSNGVVGYHDEARIRAPGVVTGRSGSIGDSSFLEVDFWPLNTSLYVSEFGKNVPQYVHYFIQWFGLARFKSGVSVPTLNRNMVHGEIIAIPGVNEQRDIATALATIDHKLTHHQKKRAALNDLFQTLLHKLMSAEIRVADVDIDTSEISAPARSPQGASA